MILNPKNLSVLVGSLLALSVVPAFVSAQNEEADDVVKIDGIELELSEVTPVGTSEDNWYDSDSIAKPDEGVVGDFVVGPGKVELSVKPGESKTVIMMVTNRTGVRRTFELASEDASGSSDPSRTVDLLGAATGPYSLKDFIKYGGTKLVLDHNERARIPVTISIPPDADPGGRYGSVLVKTVAVEGDSNEGTSIAPQSPIVARVGTLFFVTIPGPADRSGELKELSLIPKQTWYEQGPINFGILFENTGSIHLSPYGVLSITNIFGEEVGYVELDPWFAMPKSLRFREVIWNRSNLIGYYKATVEINRGYDDVIDTASVSFWVLPWRFMAWSFTFLLLGIFAIRFIYKNFEFRHKGE